ncbi:osmotically inducible protein C, partial [Pseudoalteromonas sp. S979]
HIKVEVEHTRDYYKDCDKGECTQNQHAITRKINIRGELTQAQRQRLLEIADK